jgi:hypothetical protein
MTKTELFIMILIVVLFGQLVFHLLQIGFDLNCDTLSR